MLDRSKMTTIRFHYSVSRATVTVLLLIVIVNIDHLIISTLNDDCVTRIIFFGNSIQMKEYILFFQTIASIIKILLSTIKSSSRILFMINHLILGFIYVSLVFDMVMTTTSVVNLFDKRILDEFWNAKMNGAKSYRPAPPIIYFYAIIKSAFYLGIKLYAAVMIFYHDRTILKGVYDDEWKHPLPNTYTEV